VAEQPEAPRLFDVESWVGESPSHRETVSAPSRSETEPPTAPTETSSLPVSHDETPTETDPLQTVHEAAKLEAAARARLADAVATARAAGHSWRALGVASGTPHQTLHRHHRCAVVPRHFDV
jgi:hypothetical protein